jgi:hypothetical protein
MSKKRPESDLLGGLHPVEAAGIVRGATARLIRGMNATARLAAAVQAAGRGCLVALAR